MRARGAVLSSSSAGAGTVAGTNEENRMTRSRKLALTFAAVVGVGAGGLGIAQALGQAPGEDGDRQVTGPDAERARSAALEAVGGGRVIAVEREDEGDSAWEVEVVRSDGREVEVELDGSFARVSVDRGDAAGERDDD
jgi:uncharacterized membrane protein YkoI